MTEQITVFVENKPGKLTDITHLLAVENINIKYVSIANLKDYGVIKLLVDQTDKAMDTLRTHHYTVFRQSVIIAVLQDTPGTLHDLLSRISEQGINIEDCYGFPIKQPQQVAIVIETEAPETLSSLLDTMNIKLADEVES